MRQVIEKVEKSIHLFEQGNIPALQQQLFELYAEFNQIGGGQKIINYPRKDQLAECFTLMLKFDWMHDKDIREVWAENGFYCLIKYITTDARNQVDQIAAGLNLFLHLNSGGGDSLMPKINDIIIKNKSLVHGSLNISRLFGFHKKDKADNIFDEKDYDKGAAWLIAQFCFLSAQIIKDSVRQYNLLQKPLIDNFHTVLSVKELYKYEPQQIIKKAKFISDVIESVLKSM